MIAHQGKRYAVTGCGPSGHHDLAIRLSDQGMGSRTTPNVSMHPTNSAEGGVQGAAR